LTKIKLFQSPKQFIKYSTQCYKNELSQRTSRNNTDCAAECSNSCKYRSSFHEHSLYWNSGCLASLVLPAD